MPGRAEWDSVPRPHPGLLRTDGRLEPGHQALRNRTDRYLRRRTAVVAARGFEQRARRPMFPPTGVLRRAHSAALRYNPQKRRSNGNQAACSEIPPCDSRGAPRSIGRGDPALPQAVRPRRRVGTTHQRRGRRVHRLDQPSFSEQVGPDRGNLRNHRSVLAGVDPPSGGKQGGFAARPAEQFLPRLIRSGDPRSAIVQRVAGILEHGGALGRDTRRALQHLRQVPVRLGVVAGPAGGLRRGAAVQAAPGRDCAVRAARRVLGGAEPEPHGIQAARGDRPLRGLGQRTVRRRLSAASGGAAGQKGPTARRSAASCNPARCPGRRTARGSPR